MSSKYIQKTEKRRLRTVYCTVVVGWYRRSRRTYDRTTWEREERVGERIRSYCCGSFVTITVGSEFRSCWSRRLSHLETIFASQFATTFWSQSFRELSAEPWQFGSCGHDNAVTFDIVCFVCTFFFSQWKGPFQLKLWCHRCESSTQLEIVPSLSFFLSY